MSSWELFIITYEQFKLDEFHLVEINDKGRWYKKERAILFPSRLKQILIINL